MSKHLKIVLAFLAFFTLSVDAFAADIGCTQSAYDASDKASGCNPYAGTGSPGGPDHGGGGGSISTAEGIAEQRCTMSQRAGVTGCKSKGGTTAQITSCESKVDTAEQQCIKQVESTYGPAPATGQASDHTITGNTSDTTAKPSGVHVGIPVSPLKHTQ